MAEEATLTAAPQQGEISQPLSPAGESILSSILGGPVKPSEVQRGIDLKELKKELGDQLEDGSEPAKKTEDDEEKEFTKQFQKKDEEDEDTKIEEKKEEPKKEEPKKEESSQKEPVSPEREQAQNSETEDDEAKGKIKNIGDARKFYKTSKKEKKELGEKLSAAEKELKDAREELAKLKDAPKPDADKIAEQEKEVAQLRAEREHVQNQAKLLEERAQAYNIRDTEPYKRLVTKPLEKVGADFDELVTSISDDEGEQKALYNSISRAISLEDPKARRKALEEVGSPLTSMQQGELIQLAKDYQNVKGNEKQLLADSQKAMEIIREKENMDRKERHAKTSSEFREGALEARAEMKKTYKFFERTDLPDDVKSEIKELEESIEKIDPAKLPAKEVGKITEAYYRGKILNKAASQHIAIMEKAEKEFKTKLDEALKEIETLKEAAKKHKKAEGDVDAARPNLEGGDTNSETGGKVDTIEGMVSNLFKV